jgi:hypothetical protein
MNDRDDKISKHIGRHGVSLRVVIEKLFFDWATCDHVVNRMMKEGRIVSESGLPGGLNCYRLSLSEARSRGVPEHRARPKKGAALREALQVLWFCCMSDKKRSRLERLQISKNFGNGRGSGKPHCAEDHDGKLIVYRIHAPGPNSRDEYLLKSIRGEYESAMERAEIRKWIESGTFGFAVLVETPERRERLRRMIQKHGPQEIQIIVEVVPGLSNIAMMIRTSKEESYVQTTT